MFNNLKNGKKKWNPVSTQSSCMHTVIDTESDSLIWSFSSRTDRTAEWWSPGAGGNDG